MAKRNCSVPFTEKNLEEITEIIRETFDKYLERDPQATLSKKERIQLENKSKDQLVCFIQDLGPTHEKFTFSHSKIPIVVDSSCDKENTLMDIMCSNNDNEAYLKEKDTWSVVPKGTQGSISFNEFSEEIMNLIKESASTAAFYSIESHIAYGKQYKEHE